MHIAVRHSVCQQRNKVIFIAVYFFYILLKYIMKTNFEKKIRNLNIISFIYYDLRLMSDYIDILLRLEI